MVNSNKTSGQGALKTFLKVMQTCAVQEECGVESPITFHYSSEEIGQLLNWYEDICSETTRALWSGRP